MTWFRVGGAGIPASLKNAMNAVLNKKFGTSGQNYPPKGWPDDVNLLGPLPENTVSGAVASFSDGADDVPIKSASFGIVASGGNGSPSIPVPIVAKSSVTVYHTDGQTPPVESEQVTIQLGQTIYGGSLSSDGTLTITHALVPFSDCTWAGVTSYQSNFNSTNGIVSLRFGKNAMASAGYAQKVSTALCNIFDNQSRSVWNSVNRLYEIGYADGITFNVLYSDIGLPEWTSNATNTLNAFRASSIYTNGYFALELATPIEVTGLDEININTYLGDNSIWCDTGDSEVTYRQDIALALAALQGSRSLPASLMRSSGPEEQTEDPEEVSEPEENIQNTEEQEGDNDAR